MAEQLTVTQLHFDALEPLLPVSEPGGTIKERFEKFHAANPHVFVHLKNIALYLKGIGFNHYSMKGVYERLRFAAIETTGEVYKLNNNFTAFYARKAMEDPRLEGFFELREQHAVDQTGEAAD